MAMMRGVFGAVCAAAVWLSGVPIATAQTPPALSVQAPITPEGWRALALSDLDALRDALQSQTPIPFDTINPQYPAWLRDGYAAARDAAEKAGDHQGYFYALARFTNGFRDPHIRVDPAVRLPAPLWPGFVAAARGDDAEIVWRDTADETAPPLGARISACDGLSLRAFADVNLFPYVLNPGLEADRRAAVTRLFLNRGNPLGPAPARCTVTANGVQTELELRWRGLPEGDSYWTANAAASLGPAASWGVSEPAPGVTWIGVPTFASGEQTAPQLKALIDAVNARGNAMRRGRAIVIDTRGNGGGNSSWADRLAEAVFTGGVLSRFAPRAGREAVDWRASPENVAYWRAFQSTITNEFGWLSFNNFGTGFLIGELERASRRSPPIWRQGDANPGPTGGLTQKRPSAGASPFPARVYVLSNGTCASSCLSFADRILFVPGVQLIGAATSGDGPYMEVRQVTLPSGLAVLTLPQKVYRGMPRGPLEAYAPDVAYAGPWDDASVRAWVLALIEAQHAAPAR